MATTEERRKVLEMVASGALDVGEAADLLAKMPAEPTPAAGAPPPEPQKPLRKDAGAPSDRPRWLKIRVGDLESGQRKVSVNVPLRLMEFGIQAGRSFVPELEGVDWDALTAALARGEDEGGLLVDVHDDVDGERVQIYVE